jgi:desulfoferrodoxin (superoxide reductase-like protein)
MKNTIFLSLLLLTISCNQSDQGNTPVEPITPKPEYTLEDAGEWEDIKNEHLPNVTIDRTKMKNNIRVMIPGRRFSDSHYIEKIGIMNSDKVDLDVEVPANRLEPEVTLTLNPLPSDLERTKIFVKCNLHDLWTVSLEKILNKK